jgi:hypothetical protein
LRRKNGEIVTYKRGPKKGKPIIHIDVKQVRWAWNRRYVNHPFKRHQQLPPVGHENAFPSAFVLRAMVIVWQKATSILSRYAFLISHGTAGLKLLKKKESTLASAKNANAY